jgi:hypothetical protein
MRPNDGVHYILTLQKIVKHYTDSIRQAVATQKWQRLSLGHAFQITKLDFYFYPHGPSYFKSFGPKKLPQSPSKRKFDL